MSLKPSIETGRRFFAVALAAEFLFIAAMSAFGDVAVPGMAWRFVTASLGAGISYFFAVNLFEHVHAAWRPRLFWIAAITFRLAILFVVPGDDLWRYEWEGKIQHSGFNPYVVAPDSPQLAQFRDAGWEKINHPEWRAVYPPAAELAFWAITAVSTQPLLFKIIMGLADVGVIALLLRLNTGGQQRHRDTAWYAWNPLVIYSFTGAAHFDSLMVLALTASVWALHRANPLDNQPPGWAWASAGALLLGLASSLKLVPVILLPVFAFALGRRSPALILTAVLPLATAMAYGFPGVPIFEALGDFANRARTNDLVWWLIDATLGGITGGSNRWRNLIALAVCLVLAIVFRRQWRRGLLWVLGAALILGSVLHPWYVTWILPIASWRKSCPWFVLSVTIFAYFLLWESTLSWTPWEQTIWQRLFIGLPPAALTIIGWVRGRQRPAE